MSSQLRSTSPGAPSPKTAPGGSSDPTDAPTDTPSPKRAPSSKSAQTAPAGGNVGNDGKKNPHPDFFDMVTGEYFKCHKTTSGMIVGVFAIAGTVSLSMLLMDTSYAMGVIAFTIGMLYLVLPIDFIPDDIQFLKIGLWDDALIGGGGTAAGMYLLHKAFQEHPIEISPAVISLVAILLVMICVGYFNVELRMLFVGLWAMVGQMALFPQLIQNHTVALGLVLYFFGFIYNTLPRQIIPNKLFMIGGYDLGKVDDYVAKFFVIAGIGVFVLGFFGGLVMR